MRPSLVPLADDGDLISPDFRRQLAALPEDEMSRSRHARESRQHFAVNVASLVALHIGECEVLPHRDGRLTVMVRHQHDHGETLVKLVQAMQKIVPGRRLHSFDRPTNDAAYRKATVLVAAVGGERG